MTQPRERIFNVPLIVLIAVVVLVGIQGLREFLTPEQNADLLAQFSFVPGRFTYAFDPRRISSVYETFADTDEMRAEIARFFLGDGKPLWWTTVTYAFLHGSWTHVGFNCLWLVAFGAAVARRFGASRFLIFSLFAALAGALAHFLTHMDDLQPVVGASAVVSAAMAAAVRFVFQPGAPLGETLGFGDRRMDHDHAYRQPALSLRAIFSDRRALTFLVVWLLANFLFGVTPALPGLGNMTIAWEAHVGGFLLGLLGFRFFDPPAPQPGQTDIAK
jgi:membrane associated rhomboid family serine protease